VTVTELHTDGIYIIQSQHRIGLTVPCLLLIVLWLLQ